MSTYGRDSAGSAPVTNPPISPTDIAAVTLARTLPPTRPEDCASDSPERSSTSSARSDPVAHARAAAFPYAHASVGVSELTSKRLSSLAKGLAASTPKLPGQWTGRQVVAVVAI